MASNYGSSLRHFGDRTRYWSKIEIFSYSLALDAPLGGPRLSIAIPFGMKKKTRMVGLLN